VTRDIWIEMNEAMGKVLDSATLEDMVQRQADKNKHRAEMYYI
jgi:DNA-binding IscR family transcriptional regulator